MKKTVGISLAAIIAILICFAAPTLAEAGGVLRLPAGLTQIEEEAFYNAAGLDRVELSDNIKTIGSRAFAGSSLTQINLPASITFIAEDAFVDSQLRIVQAKRNTYPYSWASSHGYTILSESPASDFRYSIFGGKCTITEYIGSDSAIIIPERINGYPVTTIGESAFTGCDDLIYATIPNCVTTIEGTAFSECCSLTGVELPNTLTSLGEGAFSGCESLTRIVIPKSIKHINSYAFFACSKLKTILISNGVTTIGSDAFAYCTDLKKISIPDSITDICEFAFEGCDSLQEIDLPKRLESIGPYAFSNCASLTHITIPSGITEIVFYTFLGCNNLVYVTLPDSLILIEEGAFEDCLKLKSIYGNKNSYAESWAKENGYGFMPFGAGTVETQDESYSISTNSDVFLGVGQEYQPAITCSDGKTRQIFALTYNSSNENVATDNGNGKLIAVSTGRATVTCNAVFYNATGADPFTTVPLTIEVNVDFAIDPTEVTIGVGESFQLSTYTRVNLSGSHPEYGYDVWSSSDSSIVSVDEIGIIHGMNEGSVVITNVQQGTGAYATCLVTVDAAPTELKCEPSVLELGVEETYILHATSNNKPLNTVTFASLDESVATVNANTGEITAVALGVTQIKATAYNGASGTCSVRVMKAPVFIQASKERVVIDAGESRRVTGIIPVDSSSQFQYRIADTTIATVDEQGNITGKRVGNTQLTIHTYNNLYTTCEVLITDVKYRALLIGNVHFPSTAPVGGATGPKIDASEIDVRSLCSSIEQINNNKYRNNIVHYIDIPKEGGSSEHPTIKQCINSAFFEADDDDVSLFFFETHGLTEGEFRGAMLGSDGLLITVSDLAQYLSNVKGTKILFLGACGSGAALIEGSPLLTLEKTYVITAAQDGTNAGSTFSGMSYFGWWLTSSMEKKGDYLASDKNKNGFVTMEELADYLADKDSFFWIDLSGATGALYGFHIKQHPQSSVDTSGYVVLW